MGVQQWLGLIQGPDNPQQTLWRQFALRGMPHDHANQLPAPEGNQHPRTHRCQGAIFRLEIIKQLRQWNR